MGSNRRLSDHKLRVRLSRPEEERQTLLPCPACGGEGRLERPVANRATQYRMIDCTWCSMLGVVDARMIRLFRRWQRIRRANRCGD